jgi:hypothetical protein
VARFQLGFLEVQPATCSPITFVKLSFGLQLIAIVIVMSAEVVAM